MSVPAGKRTLSKMEYMENYYKIYDILMYFIMKDFGIKNVVRDETAYIRNSKMLPDDLSQFKEICNRYDIRYESEYPLWVLDQFRIELFNTLNKLLLEITTANSIYPNTEYEFNLRKEHISYAISLCEYLLQCFQRIIHILPVNEEKYMSVVELILKEIDLLRGWKKSTNKMRKIILENDEIARIKAIEDLTRKSIKFNSTGQVVQKAIEEIKK